MTILKIKVFMMSEVHGKQLKEWLKVGKKNKSVIFTGNPRKRAGKTTMWTNLHIFLLFHFSHGKKVSGIGVNLLDLSMLIFKKVLIYITNIR